MYAFTIFWNVFSYGKSRSLVKIYVNAYIYIYFKRAVIILTASNCPKNYCRDYITCPWKIISYKL